MSDEHHSYAMPNCPATQRHMSSMRSSSSNTARRARQHRKRATSSSLARGKIGRLTVKETACAELRQRQAQCDEQLVDSLIQPCSLFIDHLPLPLLERLDQLRSLIHMYRRVFRAVHHVDGRYGARFSGAERSDARGETRAEYVVGGGSGSGRGEEERGEESILLSC